MRVHSAYNMIQQVQGFQEVMVAELRDAANGPRGRRAADAANRPKTIPSPGRGV